MFNHLPRLQSRRPCTGEDTAGQCSSRKSSGHAETPFNDPGERHIPAPKSVAHESLEKQSADSGRPVTGTSVSGSWPVDLASQPIDNR